MSYRILVPTCVRTRSVVALGVFIAGTAFSHVANAQAHHASHAAPTRTTSSVPLLKNLGSWHRSISTAVPLAQKYFDQGLRLYYGFNHAEAVRAFREAQRLDPKCVMCVWGEAIALGPNMNAPMAETAERQVVDAAQRLRVLAANLPTSSREGAMARAIAVRYLAEGGATRSARDSAWAAAMARIADTATDDADVQALSAEAAMNLSPWAYWLPDGSPRPGTLRLLAWLERALQRTPDHPGACHFFIHAVEAAHPERAVRCAERLAALMPGAGHIVHMPAHIYIRVGRWADAIEINRHAVHADEQYFDGPHTPESAFYAAAYQSHNHHFLTLAAVMAGASKLAIESSKQVTAIITPELARQVNLVEPMLAIPVQTLVSFGRWDDILRTPLPPSDLRVALAHTWYARGVAFAATGRMMEANATIDSIQSVYRVLPASETRVTLEIAALLVQGEIALRRGDATTAIARFNSATTLEDGLAYMEPPTWFYPVRHSLGKALLAANRPADAEREYRADLRRFPDNGWSLRGLAQALTAQRRTKEADEVERRFIRATRLADVSITSSRF